jgi:hypothetical protein
MKVQQLNATDAEKVFGAFSAASAVAADAVVQLDITTTVNGNAVVQPATAGLNAVVGIADAAIAAGGVGLVQLYGYRGTSKILLTDTTQAAGARLVAVNAQDYLRSSATGDLLFVLLESHTTGTGTVSKKVMIRAL